MSALRSPWWLVVLCGLWACDAPVQRSTTSDASLDGGTHRRLPQGFASLQRSAAERLQGHAHLAFYPAQNRAKTGLQTGYVVLYDAPQETYVAASHVPEGRCIYQQSKASEASKPPGYRGLDIGPTIQLSSPPHQWSLAWGLVRQDDPTSGPFYQLSTVQDHAFAYRSPLSFQAGGGKDLAAFRLQGTTPPRLEIDAPRLDNAGTRLERDQAVALGWTLDGDSTPLVVRLTQRDPKAFGPAALRRTVTCRFPPGPKVEIPAGLLTVFDADPEGKRSNIFFLSGRYYRIHLKGLKAPVLLSIEAITHTPVRFP